ncbi:MAG: hypothetical protein LBG75_00210 [Candidatus Nomurabacteria bacterium]|jgi:hypothetical protein|nr:hypothetical protein [Candidatus Nomurabacteria bacterium]
MEQFRFNGLTQVSHILFDQLPSEKKEFLLRHGEKVSGFNQDGCAPVFYVQADMRFAFISDYAMADTKSFEASGKGPALGLYRGGGSLVVKTNEGYLAFYDDRYKWLRQLGGIALFKEGGDLRQTAIREGYEEELLPIGLIGGKETLLIPHGVSNECVRHKINFFKKVYGVTLETKQISAEFEDVKYTLNDRNSCIEAVVKLDLSGEGMIYALAVEDKWFRGGEFMPTAIVVDDHGNKIGSYTPRQGYVPDDVTKLCPTLGNYFGR